MTYQLPGFTPTERLVVSPLPKDRKVEFNPNIHRCRSCSGALHVASLRQMTPIQKLIRLLEVAHASACMKGL